MREEIYKYLSTVDRDNINVLFNQLEKWGFFVAPCSTSHHLNKLGGLAEHSINVLRYALDIASVMQLPNVDSVVLTALLHDVGKCNDYYVDNVLTNGNISTKKPFKVNDELVIKDHALRGVLMVSPYIQLTEEEQTAILYHMGFYDNSSRDYWRNPSPLAMCLHYADMMATKFEMGEL